MKISIVPEIINSRGIEIIDENNVLIEICEKSPFKFDYSRFSFPFIVIDNFEKEKYVKIETRKIEIKTLEKLGFRLISVNINSTSGRNMKSHPGQKKAYLIKRKDAPIETGYELVNIPREHVLEMDVTNNRIRIRGRNSYPYRRNENASQWISLEDD